MRKPAAFLLLLLLLSPLLVISLTPTKAVESTVYIHADGSIEGTSSIQRNGDYYTLSSNFTGPLRVEKDNIVIDGAGFAVNNGSNPSVSLVGRMNVTLKNTIVEQTGGYIVNVENAVNCALINNSLVGLPSILNIPGLPPTPSIGPISINLLNSQGITIKDNHITFFYEALGLDWSSGHIITGNTITNGITGIDIIDSPGCVFRNNTLSDCRFSVRMYPAYHYNNDIDISNTLNGKPIYYWMNEKDQTIPTDAGYIVLVNCSNIQVANCGPQEINLVASTNSQISNVSLSGRGFALTLLNSSAVTVSNNDFRNLNIALDLIRSNGNTVSNNAFTNDSTSIFLENANNNLITSNNFTGSYYGVGCSQDTVNTGNTYRLNNFTGASIALGVKGNVTVDANRFVNNNIGVYFWSTQGSTITQNTFDGNVNGLYFSNSSNNLINLNNFLNNTHYVSDDGPNSLIPVPFSQNQYDNGARGNYWIDYNGTDSNVDGIGDAPYVLYANNKDNYPLTSQVTPSFVPPPTASPTPAPASGSQSQGSSSGTYASASPKPAVPEVPIPIAFLLMAVVLAVVGLVVLYKKQPKPDLFCL